MKKFIVEIKQPNHNEMLFETRVWPATKIEDPEGFFDHGGQRVLRHSVLAENSDHAMEIARGVLGFNVSPHKH